LKSSGKAVASGRGTAPKVRSHKRKAYVKVEDEDSDMESATVPSFHPPVQSSTSESVESSLKSNTNPGPLTRNTLTAHWATTSKISAQRQAEIDYYLLRFVICCSIAFAILDNRFFIEFLACL
jgi:hypothetical protein